MVVVLVHWAIKKGYMEVFMETWEKMTVDPSSGLFREIFTTPAVEISEAKYHTFGLENPNYLTYVNIGIWRSLGDFDRAIGKYIPEPAKKDNKQLIEMNDFEFKLRERLVLNVVKTRDGDWPLPPADF